MIPKAHDSCKTQHRMDLIFHAFQIIIDIVRRQIRGAKWQMSWNRKHLYSKPSIATHNECKVLYSYGCISVLHLSITFLPAYHRTENTNEKAKHVYALKKNPCKNDIFNLWFAFNEMLPFLCMDWKSFQFRILSWQQ